MRAGSIAPEGVPRPVPGPPPGRPGGIAPGAVLFLLAVAAGLAFGWWAAPGLFFARAGEPIVFSHARHSEPPCADCHAVTAGGRFSGIPGTASCAECHAEPIGKSKAEARLIADFIAPGREIPWRAASREPGHVFFSHAAHAKTACTACHRDVTGEREAPPSRVNRLTGRAAGAMAMNSCTACHQREGASGACDVCHI